MPKSRLPPPSSTGSSRARPLPPEPPAEDAPPPLPARPPGPGGPRGAPPPPSRPQPTQSGSSDESDQDTYEEADVTPPLPPPPSVVRKQPAPVNTLQSIPGEIYDDLDEVIEVNDPAEETYEQGETYDECDIKEARTQPKASSSLIEEELYEVPPDESVPPPEEELIEETEYEFVPENPTPSGPPRRQPIPPPPTSQPSLPARPPLSRKPEEEEELIEETEYEFVPENTTPSPPPPPPPSQPSLPARPAPNRKESQGHEGVPDLPNRPGGGRKPAPGAAPGIGVSLGDLSDIKSRLKKVSSEEKKDLEVHDGSTGSQKKADTDSFQARMNLFKQAEAKSPKPPPPTKPLNLISKSNLGPPPPPPVSSVKSPPPVQASQTATTKSPQINGLGSPPPPPSKSPQAESPGKKMADSPPPPPPPEPELEEDDIYDVGYSEKEPPDPLSEFDWYHRDLERQQAQNKLNAISQDGSFLVRKSVQGGGSQPYTLVVLYRGHVYNLKIRKRPDTKVALGEEKSDELAFIDVPALISYHRNNDVVLVNKKENKQYKTLLTKYPS